MNPMMVFSVQTLVEKLATRVPTLSNLAWAPKVVLVLKIDCQGAK